jgi:hypothetical protein
LFFGGLRLLDHIGIDVSDLARSQDIYAAALAPLEYAVAKTGLALIGFGVASAEGKSTDPGGDFWIAQGTSAHL